MSAGPQGGRGLPQAKPQADQRAVPEGRERDWEVLSRHTKGRRTRFLMGLRPDEYEKNTPKDGVVDRIQIVQYPPRVGFLEPHSDPYLRCAPRRAKRGRVVRGSRASRGVKPLWAGGVCRTAGRPRPAEGEAAGRSTRRAREREGDLDVPSRLSRAGAPGALPITRQASVLGISRGSVYYRRRPVSEEDLDLMRRIDRLHLEHPFAGSRMLRDLLGQDGLPVGRKHVATLMRRMGIEALYRKPNTSRWHPRHPVYPYLLRHLTIDRSNQVWAMDITYIPMARGFVYLAAVVDWCSRRVLAWRVSISMDIAFCLEAVEEAIHRYGTPEIFNTDQGSQFTSESFTGLLKQHGIRISMDGQGCWRDNVRCAPGRAKRWRVVRGSLASRGVKPLWAGGVCRTAGRPRPAEGEAAGRIRAVPEGRERDWEVLSRHTEGRRTRRELPIEVRVLNLHARRFERVGTNGIWRSIQSPCLAAPWTGWDRAAS